MIHARSLCLAAMTILAALTCASAAYAQSDALTRRGADIRGGVWNVPEPGAELTTYSGNPFIEGNFQRGLDAHLALESTAGVWRRTARAIQPLTGNVVETHTYIIPLFTSLKFFPVTTMEDNLEPFLLAGIGFALGIDDVGENAIGGGGSSIATGFGFKAGAGIEYHITDVFGLVAGMRYQSISYSEELGGAEKFKGFGVEGGITYRFPF
jgi:opacity protein-like surface antigen